MYKHSLSLKCKWLLVALAVLISLSLTVAVVIADTYEHKTTITVTDNSSTSRATVPIKIEAIEGDNLIAAGFVNANATDTRVLEGGYTRPFLVCDDKLIFVALNLSSEQEREYDFYMGYEPPVNSFELILGHNGSVMVADNADLEPGNAFAISMALYLDTSAAARGPIISKSGAITFDVAAEGELRLTISGSDTLYIYDVESGIHIITIYLYNLQLWVEIDGEVAGQIVSGAVPDTSSNWYLFQDDCAPYVYYYKMWTYG